jgi:hypothetical protein
VNASPDSRVRDAVTGADRRRRSRDAVRQLARLAPLAAGVGLLAAVIGRFAGWPVAVPIGLLVAVFAALGLRTYLLGRAHPPTDAMASRVDADAGLAGELRSAHWFASGEAHDPWALYHLDHAAQRAEGVSWDTLYPPVAAGRAWAGTAALAVAALAAALYAAPAPRPPSPADLAISDLQEFKDTLPPELLAKLEAMLAMMGEGELAAAGDSASLLDLQSLMAELDPALQQKLRELAEQRQVGSEDSTRRDLDAEDRADAEVNSAAGMPEDVKWALEDLAARLANSNADRETNGENPSASSETGESAMGSDQAESGDASASEAGMQMMRQAAADAGDSQMMMAGAGAMGGDSSAGEGGNSGNGSGEGEFTSIAQALRQELIEAAQDVRGDNVPPEDEDIRRKTEQGTSSLGFTRVAPPATFDRSRAVGPPTVPDARRPLLFNYFIRQR